MQDAVQDSTSSPYAYPLLIMQLLHTSFVQAPDQEIVYRGKLRMTYTTLKERIARLANGLEGKNLALNRSRCATGRAGSCSATMEKRCRKTPGSL